MAGPTDYSEKVMDHFMHPRNVGEIPNADGMGKVGNPICVTPATLVYSNCKMARIDNLSSGTKVLGSDGRYHKINRVFSRDYKGKMYSIGVHNLGEISLTPNHHVLALRTRDSAYKFREYKNYVFDWMISDELRKGDVIPYPIPVEIEDKAFIDFDIERLKYDYKSKDLPDKIKVSNGFLRLIGYYLAEGYTRTDACKGTVGFVFGAKETDYINDVILQMKEIFNIEPAEFKPRNNAISLSFYSARLARYFERHFGKGAQLKHIPHWMTLLFPAKQEHLLCGLWRGDGCVGIKGAKYCTISRELSNQIVILLLRQKIIFSYLIVPKKGIHKENYHIYVKSIPSLKKIAAIVGEDLNLPDKKGGRYKAWYDEKYFYSTIKYIKNKRYSGKVFDLEVEDNHSYVTQSAVLHNCGDIMALYIKVDGNIISDAKFKTFGCGAAIATSSMVTELVKGKTIDDALKISNKAVAEALGGLPPIKMHCSLLAEQALKAALEDYFKKKGLPLPWTKKEIKEHEHEIFE